MNTNTKKVGNEVKSGKCNRDMEKQFMQSLCKNKARILLCKSVSTYNPIIHKEMVPTFPELRRVM